MHTEMTTSGPAAGRISPTLDLQTTLESIVDAAAQLLPHVRTEIHLWDAETESLTLRAVRCSQEPASPIREGDSTVTACADWLAHHREPLLVSTADPQKNLLPEQLQEGGEHCSRAYLGVPLMAGNEFIGTLALMRDRAGSFQRRHVTMLQDLAGEAAIAVRNAALYEELSRGHRELAALSSVAAASSQALELDQLLADAVERVIEGLGGDAGGIRLLDPVDGRLVLSHTQGISEEYVAAVERLELGEGIVGEVALTGQPALVADMGEEPRLKPGVLSNLREEGLRSIAVVPLCSRDEIVGTLGVVSHTPGAFARADLGLLTAMGHQIGIAITNAQLFADTQRKARDLAALNAVASIVNQPLPLQEIMDQALERVRAAAGADAAGLQLYDQPSGEVLITSSLGLEAEDTWLMGCDTVESTLLRGLAEFCDPIVRHDSGPGQSAEVTPPTVQTAAYVPVIIGDKTVGILGVLTREHRDFSVDELDLLVAMGRQLGTATERARLSRDLEQRARELEAANAVAATVNRPGELSAILSEGLQQALTVTELEMGAIFVWDDQTGTLRLSCHRGMSSGFANWIQAHVAAKSPTVWTLVEDWSKERRIDIEEIPLDSDHVPAELRAEAIRLTADVPLFAEGEVVGVLTVATRLAHLLTPEEQSVLQAIGHQLGTAIANAQLRQEALDSERMAALGRVAAAVAHELRSPLGSVMRSAEFLARPELSELSREKLSSAIVAMARRLIDTSQELLDYSRGGQMTLHRVSRSLPVFLEEVLEVLRVDFSDRGIAVDTDWGYTGLVSIDSNRMAQVVYNIAANARDAMPDGGQLTVTTAQVGDCVELRFIDSGPGVDPDLQERIFEPFVSHGKEAGAGLGLSIARRIVQEHGGDIGLESPGEGGATFAVRLPLE